MSSPDPSSSPAATALKTGSLLLGCWNINHANANTADSETAMKVAMKSLATSVATNITRHALDSERKINGFVLWVLENRIDPDFTANTLKNKLKEILSLNELKNIGVPNIKFQHGHVNHGGIGGTKENLIWVWGHLENEKGIEVSLSEQPWTKEWNQLIMIDILNPIIKSVTDEVANELHVKMGNSKPAHLATRSILSTTATPTDDEKRNTASLGLKAAVNALRKMDFITNEQANAGLEAAKNLAKHGAIAGSFCPDKKPYNTFWQTCLTMVKEKKDVLEKANNTIKRAVAALMKSIDDSPDKWYRYPVKFTIKQTAPAWEFTVTVCHCPNPGHMDLKMGGVHFVRNFYVNHIQKTDAAFLLGDFNVAVKDELKFEGYEDKTTKETSFTGSKWWDRVFVKSEKTAHCESFVIGEDAMKSVADRTKLDHAGTLTAFWS